MVSKSPDEYKVNTNNDYIEKCLNDNGDSIISRHLTAMVFALATGICVGIIIFIAKKR